MKRALVFTTAIMLLAVVSTFAAGRKEAAAVKEDITLTVWTNSNMEAFPDGMDENNSDMHTYLQEKTGYKLKWLVGSRENALAKLSLLMVSGSPPDLLSPLSQQFFGELVAQQVLYPLDELLDKQGALFKNEKVVPAGLWLAAKYDGKIYGVPQEGAVQSHGGPLVRQDWLDEAGLSAPKTVDDYYNVLKAFKAKHPDSIPMTGNAWSVRGGISPFAGYYNAAATYIDRNGQVVDTRVLPERKEFLAFLAKLVKERLLDQEYVLNKSKNINEKVASGKVGLFSSSPWGLRDLLPAFEEKNPGGKYVFIAPAMDKDGRSGVLERRPIRGFTVIAADAKYPAEAFDLLVQYAGSREIQDFISYGEEGKHFTKDAAGLLVPTKEGEARKHNIYYVIWNTPDAHLMRAKIKGFWHVYEPTFQYSLYKEVSAYAPPIVEYDEVKQQLTDLTDEAFDKIIVGVLPLDAFDDYVKQWEQQGGKKAQDALGKWYQAAQ